MSQTTKHTQCTYTKDRLDWMKAQVRSLPQAPIESVSTSAERFLADRYGNRLSAFVQNLNLGRECTQADKLALFRALDVHSQTSLFREADSLQAICQVVLPSLIGRSPIKIASVGCSTGEEPVSILLSNWAKRHSIEICGFDINPNSIEEARYRRGWSIDNSTEAKDPASIVRRRYQSSVDIPESVWHEAFHFRKGVVPGRLDLEPTPDLRSRVNFNLHDILLEPLPTQQDVVVLNHVLYHFTPMGREEIMKNIRESIRPGGCFVGDAARTIANVPDKHVLSEWYNGLEKFNLERVKLPIWKDWCRKTFDLTSEIFVYRAPS